jgi:uncharacterized protein YutE (UPF0331/DUF86 family)
MINGVILQKLQSLEQALSELRSLGELNVNTLEGDWRTCRAVERNLQILVEVVIDICQRLIALTGQSPATSGRDAIERSIRTGILSDAPAYRQMAQFRNFIVHRYEQIDAAILVNMVNRQLADFDRFRDEILHHVSQNNSA